MGEKLGDVGFLAGFRFGFCGAKFWLCGSSFLKNLGSPFKPWYTVGGSDTKSVTLSTLTMYNYHSWAQLPLIR